MPPRFASLPSMLPPGPLVLSRPKSASPAIRVWDADRFEWAEACAVIPASPGVRGEPSPLPSLVLLSDLPSSASLDLLEGKLRASVYSLAEPMGRAVPAEALEADLSPRMPTSPTDPPPLLGERTREIPLNAEDRDWNEPERIRLYSTLGPFNWFNDVAAPSMHASTGRELMQALYEDILAAAEGDPEAEHFYFDASERGDDLGPGTCENPYRSLWRLRLLLMDSARPKRKVVCHLKRGCCWTYGEEAVWNEMWRGLPAEVWGVDGGVVAAALDAFTGEGEYTLSMLTSCPDRANLTLCAYSDEQDVTAAMPLLDGTGGCEGFLGLTLDVRHQRIYASEIAFKNFLQGIVVRAGCQDVFYRLSFDDPRMRVAIDLQPDTSKYETWGDYFRESGRALPSDDVLRHLIRSYPTQAPDYSREILIGFCAFRDIGIGLFYLDPPATGIPKRMTVIPPGEAYGFIGLASQGAMAVGLNICATEICVDHCTFDRCQDGVTGGTCSSGHLIFCNSFRNAPYGDPWGFYWEDGNGVDLINAAPRTETAWVGEDSSNRTAKRTAIFDNVFYHCQGNAITLHWGGKYVDIFNNYFVGTSSSAVDRAGVPLHSPAISIRGDVLTIVSQ